MGLTSQQVEGFVQSMLLKSFDDAKPIPECHKEWWEACCSDNQFVAIAAPRGFAKSTAITYSYVLAKVLFRESRFVIIVSDSESQATLFLNDIKKELQTNDDLRGLFDISEFIKDAETDIIVAMKDGHEFRIMAKGSEQKLRGLKWNKMRPDLIVCDDMENDELVMNKDRREKLKKWFSSALLPVRSDKGLVRVVGTILHFDSLLESLMPKEKAKGTIVTPLKTWSSRQVGAWTSTKYRAHGPDFSPLLWPEKKSASDLRKIREMYENQGLLDVYSQEYLNNPIDDTNTHFRRGDFQPITDEDREKNLTYYITFDGAWSLGQRSDFSVLMVSGMDSDGYIHLKHVIRQRMDPLEFADTLFELVKIYDPMMVVTEKGAFANSILPAVYKRMEEQDLYFRLELFTPSVDKVTRSQAIRLRARAGRLKADKNADWWNDFEEECLKFPRGFDDQVDALSLIGLTLNKFSEAPTKEEVAEEEWEEAKREAGMSDQGRSEITGY